MLHWKVRCDWMNSPGLIILHMHYLGIKSSYLTNYVIRVFQMILWILQILTMYHTSLTKFLGHSFSAHFLELYPLITRFGWQWTNIAFEPFLMILQLHFLLILGSTFHAQYNSLPHLCQYQGTAIFSFPIINSTASSAPREERCLLLESLSESVSEIAELFWCSNMAPGSEIPGWNILTKKNFRWQLPLNKYTGHLNELQRALPILQSLTQVQNLEKVAKIIFLWLNQQFLLSSTECKSHLTPHHTHLLFKHQPVKTFVRLKDWRFEIDQMDFVTIIHLYWPQRVCEGHRRYPGQSSCHSTCPTPGPLSHGRMAPKIK